MEVNHKNTCTSKIIMWSCVCSSIHCPYPSMCSVVNSNCAHSYSVSFVSRTDLRCTHTHIFTQIRMGTIECFSFPFRVLPWNANKCVYSRHRKSRWSRQCKTTTLRLVTSDHAANFIIDIFYRHPLHTHAQVRSLERYVSPICPSPLRFTSIFHPY